MQNMPQRIFYHRKTNKGATIYIIHFRFEFLEGSDRLGATL